jgi:2-methylisocitrate lyase-like PEP mutase family enzyme
MEQVEQIPKQFNVPCMINMVPLSPCPSIENLQKLGYGIAVFPGACLVPSVKAIVEALKVFKETGTPPGNDKLEFLEVWSVFNQLLGVPLYNELEQKYKS